MRAWPIGFGRPWFRARREPKISAMTQAPPRPNRPVYLDNQATTRCDPRVLAAMLPYFSEEYGNPASAEHIMGHTAEKAVEDARAHIAALLGADTREIVLTSGATESNNIGIKGAARYAKAMSPSGGPGGGPSGGDDRRRIVTVATEHKCVLESVADLADEGFEPVCFGPSMNNFREIASAFLAAGAAIETRSAAEVVAFAGQMFDNDQEQRSLGGRARAVVQRNRGASERTARHIVELLS